MTETIPKIRPFNRTKHLILAPFSERHRRKLRIANAPEAIQLLARDIIMTEDRKLLFVKNAKAGCSSVAHLLYEYDKGARHEGSIHKHGIGQLNGLADWDLANEMLTDPTVFRFTTVRNPIKRAVSCFKNFFVDQTNKNYAKYAKIYHAKETKYPKTLEGQFDAYLEIVEASFQQDRIYSDPHWRTQVLNIGHGSVDYNRICRLENYAEDLARVFEEAGTAAPDSGKSLAIKQNSTTERSFAPNKGQISRLEKLYAEDFEAFGY